MKESPYKDKKATLFPRKMKGLSCSPSPNRRKVNIWFSRFRRFFEEKKKR